jgi:hypothetical protein
MTTWFEVTEGIVEGANIAMAEIAKASGDDMEQRIRAIWEPVATALAASIREDFEHWPERIRLAKELGFDFLGQTSDTGRIVAWGRDHGPWREFQIHR